MKHHLNKNMTKRIQMKYLTMICGLALTLGAQTVFGLSSYVNRIPNGSAFSCNTCHGSSGPPLNGFGSDFLDGGARWNAALANLDSDGDGFRNGAELGDPNGTWVAGNQNPAVTASNPGNASSKPATVSAPTITTQPASRTVTAGQSATFTVAASGTAPLSYQWQKDTVNLTGATTATLTLSSVTSANAGSYRAVVSNSGGSATSAAATLTVNPAVVAPAITTQPASQTITAGANVTFSVAASGTAPLSYQWQKDTVNLTGATTATLTLSSVTSANAGSYRAVVSNSGGSATSAAATLTINPAVVAPAITTQPASQTVTAGASVTFTVAASGTGPLSYQWQKDTVNLTGATSATLTLSSVTSANAGSYRAVVSNSGGSATSAAATLAVNPAVVAPTITTQPANQTVTAGANVTFTVAASGTGPLSYQWQKDTVNLTGATSATLTLSGVTSANAGSYRAVVSNSGGSATSAAATLAVNPATAAPAITTQPANQTVTAGANVSFTVAASGTAPLSYQWQKNAVNLAGATRATLTLSSVTSANAGSYRAMVSNSAGSATSAGATLVVNPAPALSISLASPINDAVYSTPANVPLAVTVSGGTLASVAYFDDTNLLDIVTDAPFAMTASNMVAGGHVLTAIATDAAGETATSESVSITITSTTPPGSGAPVVSMVAPRNGATFGSPARILLTANAADAGGRIVQVVFYSGTTRLGAGVPVRASEEEEDDDDDDDDDDHHSSTTGTLYFLSWSRVPAGQYVVTARATDNLGVTTISAPVRVTVSRHNRRH
jgi:large repetitive protein